MKYIISALAVIMLLAACNMKSKKPPEGTKSTGTKGNIKKVLFVLTSHDQLGKTEKKTGFWLEEFATPYYTLKDQNIDIVIASPKGGQPPIDPKSKEENFQTPATKRFNQDKETQEILANSLKLAAVKEADYDAIFYPGGHGPLWDLSEDPNSIKLIEAFYTNKKPIAAVCHAPAVLKNVKNIDGTPLVKGKKVTGFTNTEEEAVGLTAIVPFLVEDMLKENGGIFSRTEDWNAYAVRDSLLITGQNPASSEKVAVLLLQALE